MTGVQTCALPILTLNGIPFIWSPQTNQGVDHTMRDIAKDRDFIRIYEQSDIFQAIAGVPDPANATGTDAEIGVAFAEAYRMLHARISIFVNLPLAKIDKLSLQRHLHDIGAMDRPDRKSSSAA